MKIIPISKIFMPKVAKIKDSIAQKGFAASQDTFIKRNKIRDKEYEKIFSFKQNINGRRIHSTMYSRTSAAKKRPT